MQKQMIELMIIRHGETDWNLERRLQGGIDIPLNQTGVRQARALATALRNESFDAIVCSDLQRAIQTAQLIATPKNLQCQITPHWRERSFGGFEGELISTLAQRFPAEYAAWRSYEVDSHFPPNPQGLGCGESIREFNARISNALHDLCHRYANQKIAVVAHGGVLECAYRISQQLPLNAPRQVSMLNASMNRFELGMENGQLNLSLIQWGDVAHLEAAQDEIA
jgi:probable phosphoglycerate mutase